MKTPFLETIVWAVDSLEPEEFQLSARDLLKTLTREVYAKVYPVHVFSYPFTGLEGNTLIEEAFRALAEKRLKKLVELSGIVEIQPGRILVDRSGSTRRSAEILLEYADEIMADAILVSTHSRGKVAKLFMGSFAESLLLQSPIPIITVNPSVKIPGKITKVLFPTSFESRFRNAFQETVRLCSSLGANLTLFYKEPLDPFLPLLLKDGPSLYALIDERVKNRKIEAETCRQWARDHSVPLEICMDDEPGKVAEAIEEFAVDHSIDLIVMVSETAFFEGPRVGGVCRKVVRSAECPVWTIKTDDIDED